MEKRSMFRVFEEIFEENLSETRTRRESFNEASKTFADNFGFEPYKNHDSFMATRSYHKSRKARR